MLEADAGGKAVEGELSCWYLMIFFFAYYK